MARHKLKELLSATIAVLQEEKNLLGFTLYAKQRGRNATRIQHQLNIPDSQIRYAAATNKRIIHTRNALHMPMAEATKAFNALPRPDPEKPNWPEFIAAQPIVDGYQHRLSRIQHWQRRIIKIAWCQFFSRTK